MAEYTLTINDEDGSVSVRISGPAPDSPAGRLAFGLLTMAPKLLSKISRPIRDCNCEECQALRASLLSKPTYH